MRKFKIKDIQEDLGIFMNIQAYSGIFGHNEVYLGCI